MFFSFLSTSLSSSRGQASTLDDTHFLLPCHHYLYTSGGVLLFFNFGHEGFWTGSGSQRYPPWFFSFLFTLDMYITRWLHSQPSSDRWASGSEKIIRIQPLTFWLLSWQCETSRREVAEKKHRVAVVVMNEQPQQHLRGNRRVISTHSPFGCVTCSTRQSTRR